jgi:TonB family protein
MNPRGAVVGSLVVSLAVLAASPCALADKDNPAELQANLQKAAVASSPNTTDIKPWHMKISAQLFDLTGNSTGTGTIEEWWMAPGNEKRVFAFPDYQGTEILTTDGVYRSAGLASEPMWIAALVDQIVDPMVAQQKLSGAKPTGRTLQLGGVTLPCVMLAKPNSRVATPPIGFYPSWCTEPGKDSIRVSLDNGGEAIIRNGISAFQGKSIPMELSVTVNGTVVASGHVDDISLDGMPTAPFAPGADLTKAPPRPVELKGKKFESQASHREEPDFSRAKQPNQMIQGRNGMIQGDVEVRLWVGEDGQIRDMLLESYPDAGAAQATMDAVRHWVFHPFQVEGRAVPFTGTLDFEINSTDYDRQMRQGNAVPGP